MNDNPSDPAPASQSVLPTVEDHEDAQTVEDAGPEQKYFTQVPNLVLTLGLSPYALALYVHLKRVTGKEGVCFKSTATLAADLNMSTGSISQAKQELADVHKELPEGSGKPFKGKALKGKPLITITKRKNRNGGKPRHHITLTDIWAENVAAFAKPEAHSSARGSSSYSEIASSSGERASSYSERTISPGEIKKIPSDEKPAKKTPTHRHLRAAGAPVEGVGDGPKSRHPLPELKRFYRWKKTNGANIDDPDAVAMARYLDGHADDEVDQFLALPRDGFQQPQVVARKCPPECPLCYGTGM
jgi:hypothetical protein